MRTVAFTTSQIKRAKLDVHYDLYEDLFGEKFDTNFVPGVGNVNSPVVFVGEAPGVNEDRQREPFVGESGKLLNRGLKVAGLKRRQVFITNFLKYRPPDNRDPVGDEVPVCMHMLRNELNILMPRLVVTLGRFSTSLFWEQPHMGTLAGQVWVRRGFTVLPMFHPAAVLHGGQDKDDWLDTFIAISDVLAMPQTDVAKPVVAAVNGRKHLSPTQSTPVVLKTGRKPLRRS